MRNSWKEVSVSPETLLKDTIGKMNISGVQIAIVIDEDDHLLGILTDGNIRRAISGGKSLQVPVSEIMNQNPTVVPENTPRGKMLAIMRQNVFHHLPIVDEQSRVVGLVTLDELIGGIEQPNWVVLMAGGKGKRLLPLTENCPKPLLPIGGKPILESIIESFIEQGFKRIFLSVNYKAEMIRDHFGSGERWGVELEYLHESTQLGTAGALSLLKENPNEPIIVMNSDLMTNTNFVNLLQFHLAQEALATMAVCEYDFQVPFGVVQLDGTRIQEIEEKPVQKFFVNAGICVLSPEVLEYIPKDSFFDMPMLFEKLISAEKKTAAYPLNDSWLDIGKLEEFERAQKEWEKIQL